MVDSRKANTPVVVRKIEELRRSVLEWRGTGARIALVPTMGALHAGHLALVKAARETADRVVVSIFVNPTQFAPNEDFASYPRDESADVGKLVGTGTDAVFAPGVAEMYPQGFATSVIVGGPAEGLESAYRPHFFTGVATVVSKLLLACLPDSALFGEKDYQQLLVIRRMVADLAIPVGIVGCPTLREGDGLALSSRNAYLGPAERFTRAPPSRGAGGGGGSHQVGISCRQRRRASPARPERCRLSRRLCRGEKRAHPCRHRR